MPRHFSFSGCGFLGIYHFGVSACLKQHVPKLLEDCKIAGASAGSFIACCLITGCSIDDCARYFADLVQLAQSQPILGPLHPRFQLISELRESMIQVLPEDAYKIASGRLFISLTRYKDLKNVIVSEFESNAELIEAMLCSSFIPFYCGIIPPRYKGDYYWDGGLSDNQPIFNEPTITVSPFSGEVDICPMDNSSNFIHLNVCNSSVQFTEENFHRVSIALFPPNAITMSEIFQQGYNDALQYLQKNAMINCTDHLNVPAAPNFQREKKQADNQDKKEKLEKTPEEDDLDCRECKQKLRKSLFSSLPPHLLQVFHSTMASKKQSILKYICEGKLFQALSRIVSPFIAPADILWVYVTSLISNIPRRQQELEHILKQTYLLFFCFLQNYLYKPCKHNKQWIKNNECIEAASPYHYFNNNMDRKMLEQIYQSMDKVPRDYYDSSQIFDAISPNTEVQVKKLRYNQETPTKITGSKEFHLSCSCSLDTRADHMSPRKSRAGKPHLEISDPVLNNFNKEQMQNKNNIQTNKSKNMEAYDQQSDRINLPNLEQDSTMMDKPFLERSQSDLLCESIHDKECRSTTDSVIRNKSGNMEADKSQYLSKNKGHDISTDQLLFRKLTSGPLLWCQCDMEIHYDEEDHPKNQMESMKTHKEDFYIGDKCGFVVNKSLIKISVGDCELDLGHGRISDISQITNSKTVEAHLDDLDNETISPNSEENYITTDRNHPERSPGDQLEFTGDVEEMFHTKYNAVQTDAQKEQNSQLELSKCDGSNDKTSNCNISSNYRNVRTLIIQNYTEDSMEMKDGVEAEYNQEINKANNIFSQIKGFLSLIKK